MIQDLFATGMALDAVQPLISDPLVAERVAATIDQLDATIRQIRSTIFELETSDALRGDGAELLRRTVEARGDQLGFPAALVITGDLDDVPSTVLDHVLAVVSESLSNTARHARATRAEVDLTIARSGAVTLTVCDDGVGFDPAHPTPGSGLANMRRRAELLGARLVVRSAVGAGTSLELTVPALA